MNSTRNLFSFCWLILQRGLAMKLALSSRHYFPLTLFLLNVVIFKNLENCEPCGDWYTTYFLHTFSLFLVTLLTSDQWLHFGRRVWERLGFLGWACQIARTMVSSSRCMSQRLMHILKSKCISRWKNILN